MVKRLLADTFFLHLHRKSSSYSSCFTTQMIASPGQAANPTEMTLLPPDTAPGCLLVAMSAGPGPPQERRELRNGRLHHKLPWPRTSWFSCGAGSEALPYCSRLFTCFPPAHPLAPSHPQPHTLTWHTCRRSHPPECLASQTAPAPALCLRLAARTEERSGHKRPVHTTAQLPAETLAPRDNTEHEQRARLHQTREPATSFGTGQHAARESCPPTPQSLNRGAVAQAQATGTALPDREGSTTTEAASLLPAPCLDTGRLRSLESSNGAVAGTPLTKAELLPIPNPATVPQSPVPGPGKDHRCPRRPCTPSTSLQKKEQ